MIVQIESYNEDKMLIELPQSPTYKKQYCSAALTANDLFKIQFQDFLR